MALTAIVLVYLLISLQVIKAMGASGDFSAEALNHRGQKLITKTVGYHRVDVSMMLAGGSWAAVSLAQLAGRKMIRLALLGAAAIIALGVRIDGRSYGLCHLGLWLDPLYSSNGGGFCRLRQSARGSYPPHARLQIA